MTAQSSIANSINSIVNQSDSVGASSRVVQAIKTAAAKTGVDFSYLMKKAAQESGFDSTAKAATSSATGLFQFTSQTWLQMVKNNGAQYGLGAYASQISADAEGHLSVSDSATKKAILALRNDPQISAEMAGELDKQNASTLQQSVGGKIGGTELYLAHFLGAGGASDFLTKLRSSPSATGASVLPEAAAANQSVFYNKSGQARTIAEIYQSFAQKFGGGTTQVASAATTPSVPSTPSTSTVTLPSTANAMTYAAAMQAHVPMSLANLFQQSSPASASIAPSSSIAGFRAADGGNMVLSGASTMFTAMVMGQMHGAGLTTSSPLAALQESTDKKKIGYSVLAAVA